MQSIQANPRNRRLLPWLAYPGVMLAGLWAYHLMLDLGWGLQLSSYATAVGAGLMITGLERLCPHFMQWQGRLQDVRTDLAYMLLVQIGLPTLLAVTLSMSAVHWLAGTGMQAATVWPHLWPIGWQVVLMLLAADFLRYWLHRAAHRYAPLWRLHAVHHSVPKLYWLNVGRFHPLEKLLQYLLDALPFVLMQVNPEVLALYFVFYSINGFFQHSNVELRLGWLNWLISGAELHRWHHSRRPQESNANYGNNLIIWDVLFGTRILPADRQVSDLGLRNRHYPLGFLDQMRTPFWRGIENAEPGGGDEIRH